MKEPPDETSLFDRIRSWIRSKPHVVGIDPSATDNNDDDDYDDHRHPPVLPITNTQPDRNGSSSYGQQPVSSANGSKSSAYHNLTEKDVQPGAQLSSTPQSQHAPAAAPVAAENGEEPASLEPPPKSSVLTVPQRIFTTTKVIILSSWINWLLVFVPVGLVFGAMHKSMGSGSPVSPTVVFSINAVAIIPLASLLSFATESVASKLGDKIGALMNVTFGNAVELLILYVVSSSSPPLFTITPSYFTLL